VVKNSDISDTKSLTDLTWPKFLKVYSS